MLGFWPSDGSRRFSFSAQNGAPNGKLPKKPMYTKMCVDMPTTRTLTSRTRQTHTQTHKSFTFSLYFSVGGFVVMEEIDLESLLEGHGNI